MIRVYIATEAGIMPEPERDWFIRAAGNFEMVLTNERRTQLALKGQRLYAKYCGLNGEGICAESFAEYHALRGEYVVVEDFLDFLRKILKDAMHNGTDTTQIQMTEALIQRIETLLD